MMDSQRRHVLGAFFLAWTAAWHSREQQRRQPKMVIGFLQPMHVLKCGSLAWYFLTWASFLCLYLQADEQYLWYLDSVIFPLQTSHATSVFSTRWRFALSDAFCLALHASEQYFRLPTFSNSLKQYAHFATQSIMKCFDKKGLSLRPRGKMPTGFRQNFHSGMRECQGNRRIRRTVRHAAFLPRKPCRRAVRDGAAYSDKKGRQRKGRR